MPIPSPIGLVRRRLGEGRWERARVRVSLSPQQILAEWRDVAGVPRKKRKEELTQVIVFMVFVIFCGKNLLFFHLHLVPFAFTSLH